MQTLHDLLIRVLLAFCLPAALVATVATTKTPYCAAPPLDITDYGIDFWVQVVFLKRLSNLRETLEYLPLGVQKDIDPRGDVHHSHDSRKREDRDDIDAYFDRLVIAPEFLSTSALFRLKGSRLLHDGYPAVLWPDEYTPDETQRDIDLLSETGHGGEDPTSVFNGFNNVGFDFRTTSPVKISQVKFRIVKVCTPDKNTELQLRGRLHGDDVEFYTGYDEYGSESSILVKRLNYSATPVDSYPVPIKLRVKRLPAPPGHPLRH